MEVSSNNAAPLRAPSVLSESMAQHLDSPAVEFKADSAASMDTNASAPMQVSGPAQPNSNANASAWQPQAGFKRKADGEASANAVDSSKKARVDSNSKGGMQGDSDGTVAKESKAESNAKEAKAASGGGMGAASGSDSKARYLAAKAIYKELVANPAADPSINFAGHFHSDQSKPFLKHAEYLRAAWGADAAESPLVNVCLACQPGG